MATRTSIDGVLRPEGNHSVLGAHLKKMPALAKPKPKSTGTHHQAKRKLQKSRTLVRSGLKRPTFLGTDWKNQQQQLDQKAVPISEVILGKTGAARLARASKIPKNHLIARFTSSTGNRLVKKIAHMPVVKPSTHMPQPATAKIASGATRLDQSQAKPDLFDDAINRATSHEAKPVRAPKAFAKLNKKPIRFGTGALLALLIVGFFTYRNLPTIKMRIATSKASVNASLPNYQPAGFTLGAITPSPGEITVNFRSNTDSRSFQLTQKKSSWNSEALLANYVTTTSKPYQTYQELGKTIYIYDQSNATWVDGGLWYRIEGDAQLTSDQLLRMARSL